MSSISLNLKQLRRKLGLTQEELAQKLGITRSSLGAYEEGRAEPKIELLKEMAAFFELKVDDLISENALDAPSGNVRVVTFTTDADDNPNIELVPVKAAAGYMAGFADPEYIEELPRFSLPMLPKGRYRAFEISGDSMLPLPSGTVVVAELLNRIEELREGQLYIVISQNDGIVFKRVFYSDRKRGILKLQSDNTAYSPYELEGREVMEIWRAKAYISTEFPEDGMSLEKLSGIVLNLQKQVGKIQGES